MSWMRSWGAPIVFASLDLHDDNLREDSAGGGNVLGDAYEYLINRFADDAGKKGGEFYTPRPVVRLIIELLQPREGMRICDPTAGSGGMLIYAAQYVQEHGGDLRDLALHGQERNLGTLAIGLLHNRRPDPTLLPQPRTPTQIHQLILDERRSELLVGL